MLFLFGVESGFLPIYFLEAIWLPVLPLYRHQYQRRFSDLLCHAGAIGVTISSLVLGHMKKVIVISKMAMRWALRQRLWLFC